MSIADYQTPEAMELLSRIGWPEWVDPRRPGERRFLWRDATGNYLIETEPLNEPVLCIEDHAALCLLRDHLREWLRAKNYRVDWTRHTDGDYWFWTGPGGTGDGIYYDTEDKALIAAARAALEADNAK